MYPGTLFARAVGDVGMVGGDFLVVEGLLVMLAGFVLARWVWLFGDAFRWVFSGFIGST